MDAADPLFDIGTVPFSRYGSYHAIADLTDDPHRPDGTYLRTLRGDGTDAGGSRAVFRIDLLDGDDPVSPVTRASPAKLRLDTPSDRPGHVDACFAAPDVLRFRGADVGIRLTLELEPGTTTGGFEYAWEHLVRDASDGWTVFVPAQSGRYQIQQLHGSAAIEEDWDGTGCSRIVLDFYPEDSTAALGLQAFRSEDRPSPRQYDRSFDACVDAVGAEFGGWVDDVPDLPEAPASTRCLAAYVTWVSVVRARGQFTRPGMLMSKNWMAKLWSWDQCFNAMGLALHAPDLAWDQFCLPFDHQNDDGRLPDSIDDDRVLWQFTKPPVHGWALDWIDRRTELLDANRLAEIYEPLARWTEWWFDHRDPDDDGIPAYRHGNTTADNSTYFLDGPEIESPDLAACLVRQCEALATVADRTDRPAAAERWADRGATLVERLLDHSWNADRGCFEVLTPGSHEPVRTGDGLLPYRALVAADRFPDHVVEGLVADVRDRFLTDQGLASESPASSRYEPEGYWRGPIWPPEILLIVDGLDCDGRTELSTEIASRFCRTIETSGMAENFNAETGDALQDRSYTWTANAFLVLQTEYLD